MGDSSAVEMPPPDVRLNLELITLPDKEGEYRKESAAKTTRYFPGQAPAYAAEEDDDEDDLSTILAKRNAAAAVVEDDEDEKPDPRVQRMQKDDSDSDEDDEVA